MKNIFYFFELMIFIIHKYQLPVLSVNHEKHKKTSLKIEF